MPKLSIIIPIYNVEKYLDKCVQSARNQTLQDIEIILVDDESPDACPQMCEEYAKTDARIKVVHRKNGGLGFARNSGIDVATGEYITFLDSDDYVDLDAYENLTKLMDFNNADIVYYKLNRFTNNDEIKKTIRNEKIECIDEDRIKDLMLDVIASDLSVTAEHKVNCSSCTAIYRLSIIKNHNINFHSERELISEDLIFNLDVLKYCKKVIFSNTKYYHYRFNTKSLTNTIRLDRVEKNLELYNYINNNLLSWGLDYTEGSKRSSRMFIGFTRSFMGPILKSELPLKEKYLWLDKVLSYSIWTELYKKFPWKRLPLYARIHFFAIAKKYKRLLLLIAYIR